MKYRKKFQREAEKHLFTGVISFVHYNKPSLVYKTFMLNFLKTLEESEKKNISFSKELNVQMYISKSWWAVSFLGRNPDWYSQIILFTCNLLYKCLKQLFLLLIERNKLKKSVCNLEARMIECWLFNIRRINTCL